MSRTTFRLAILFLATSAYPFMRPAAQAAPVFWTSNVSSEVWGDGGNWSGGAVPGAADHADIGGSAAAENTSVRLNQPVDVSSLAVTDGMTLLNLGPMGSVYPLTVQHDSLVSGGNLTDTFHYATLRVFRGITAADFRTNILNLQQDGNLDMRSAVVRIGNQLRTSSGGNVQGSGTIDFAGLGVSLINDGYIDPQGETLIFNQLSGGLYDLDGQLEHGVLRIDGNAVDGSTPDQMVVNGSGLSDSFSGTIYLRTDSALTMNLSDGWTADGDSVIRLEGRAGAVLPARLFGSHVNLGGTLRVVDTDGFVLNGVSSRGAIEAAATLQGTANVEVAQENRLDFNQTTAIEGGTYVVAEDATLEFNAPTTIEGGAFTTFSDKSSEGAVRFDGATTWAGVVTINGVALQDGPAAVNGLTHINANVFDMDGGGNTAWDVNHIMTITADSIDSTISNTFDGTLDVDNFFSLLKIELTGGFDKWTMNGELNLNNPLPVGAAVRVDGSTMRVTGDLNTDGRVRIAANAEFAGAGQISFADGEAELAMEQLTIAEAGATFLGDGTLRNRSTGELVLLAGASLADVGLVNEGQLKIGNSPGIAQVDRFENAPDGVWGLEIGGHVAGTEHDFLAVTDGPTTLGGTLTVDLIDAGGGLFLPEIGDEFTILTSFAAISGAFLDEPVSHAAGHAYFWKVLYHPHDVTLRLDDVTVPEPRSLAFAALSTLAILRSSPRSADRGPAYARDRRPPVRKV
jgi:hypothetical protein